MELEAMDILVDSKCNKIQSDRNILSGERPRLFQGCSAMEYLFDINSYTTCVARNGDLRTHENTMYELSSN